MACQGCPACKAILSQATAKCPNRNRASDGMCASQQHSSANPSSDHEPDSRGLAHATDLTHDPAHGCDAHSESDKQVARRDRRIKYRISKRRITSYYPVGNYPAWADRPYHGSNPHDRHAHTSVRREFENDVSAWFDDEEDDLAGTVAEQILAEVQQLRTDVTELQSSVGKKYPGGPTLQKSLVQYGDADQDPTTPNIPQEHLVVIQDMLSELLNRQAEMEGRLLAIETKLNEQEG